MSDLDDPLANIPSFTPRSSLGSGVLSYSSSSISPSTSSSGSHGSAKSAVSECLGAWLNYLQILNNLCGSGYRLAQTISTLEQWGINEQSMYGSGGGGVGVGGASAGAGTSGNNINPMSNFSGACQMPPPPLPLNPLFQQNSPVSSQFVTAWDDLARATAVATSTVKTHIVAVLQDFITQPMSMNVIPSTVGLQEQLEQQQQQQSSQQQLPPPPPPPPMIDIQRLRDHNQQIILETAQTMINIQHQFCVASYDSFSSMMCCFVCQAPVGFAHDPDCALLQQQQQQQQQQQPSTHGHQLQHQIHTGFPQQPRNNQQPTTGDPRSQTPSPHFGPIPLNYPNRGTGSCGGIHSMNLGGNIPIGGTIFGSNPPSQQASTELICGTGLGGGGIVVGGGSGGGSGGGAGIGCNNSGTGGIINTNNQQPAGQVLTGMIMERQGTSPSLTSSQQQSQQQLQHHQHQHHHHQQQHEIRGPSPIQGFLENIRGPLPNPGHLLGMKIPFYRPSRSPLNFPLFPLNGQRRWSEAAAGEVQGQESSILDAESNMRRWSMPWEASCKSSVKNTVTWHHTRMMPPVSTKLAVPNIGSKIMNSNSGDRSQSTTPDSNWHSSITSQDGLVEAIHLLSCRPARIYQPPPQIPLGPPFIEEPHTSSSTMPSDIGTYEMWSDKSQRLPSIKFNRDREFEKD